MKVLVIYGVQPLLVADWLPFSLPLRGFITNKINANNGFCINRIFIPAS